MQDLPKKKEGSIRLIAAADLHLGRSLCLPEIWKTLELSVEKAWESLVGLVTNDQMEIDALLLAGDLFDREDNVLEVPFLFEKGLRRIAAKRKKVVAIAGNHDYKALSKRKHLLAYPEFHLLGEGGVWESVELQFGERTICFEGWSFPSSTYSKSPLETLPPRKKEPLIVTILHGECGGNKESCYAPFTERELLLAKRDLMVLGHIHIPKMLQQQPDIFYCGSLQGLDSTEVGPRGAFIIDIDRSGNIESTFCPLAALLWMKMDFDVTDIDLEEYAVELQKKVQKSIPFWDGLKVLSFDIIWRGYTPKLQESLQKIHQIEGSYFSVQKNGTFLECFINSCKAEIRPKIDLQLLAGEKSPLGWLATKILDLEKQDSIESKNMLRKAKEFLEQRAGHYPHFSHSLTNTDLEKNLLFQATELLADLFAQREL